MTAIINSEYGHHNASFYCLLHLRRGAKCKAFCRVHSSLMSCRLTVNIMNALPHPSKDVFATMFDFTGLAVALLDRYFLIQQTNSCFERMVFQPEQELEGKPITDFVVPVGKSVNAREFLRMINHSETLATVKRQDGIKMEIWCQSSSFETEDEKNYLVLFREASPDTSGEVSTSTWESEFNRQIRLRDKEIAALRRELEIEKEKSQKKSHFVSLAAHEFRTPLSGILSSTYLLSKYVSSEDQPMRDKNIKRINTSVRLLNDMMSDFLSVDWLDQGDFRLNPTRFQVTPVVHSCIADLTAQAKAGQVIDFCCDLPDDMAYLDQSMFQYILNNLFSNALKYSPENTKVEACICHSGNTLKLTVKDEGMGIPPDEMSKLFTRFFRASNVGGIQGTGLGLSIVEKYVQILDGKIGCRSTLGAGTEFTVTFNNQKERYEENTGR